MKIMPNVMLKKNTYNGCFFSAYKGREIEKIR